jgi:formate-nitrite transporter family protein
MNMGARRKSPNAKGNPEKPVAAGQDTAGASSQHLDTVQQQQAAAHASPQAIVIHEVVREEGENELKRPSAALLWSALAAGLSMGFSLLMLALLKASLPRAPWTDIIAAPGYCVGFIIAILGRQQLFTESTLTAMLPLFVHPDRKTILAVMRLWGIVLCGNLLGTIAMAALLSLPHTFAPAVNDVMRAAGDEITHGEMGPTFLKAVFAGWLIALMVWVLPSARSARLLVILVLTYVVALGHFPHIIAGSVEATYALFAGAATFNDYALGFLLPTLLGNTVGGVALAALLNHAPLVNEF